MVVTGLLNTDVMNSVDCPRCYQPAGTCCMTHRGKKLAAPHAERVAVYDSEHPDRKTLYVASPTQREQVSAYNRKHHSKE